MIRILFLAAYLLATQLSAQDHETKLYVINGLGRTLSSIEISTGIVHDDIITTGTVPNRLHVYKDKIYIVNSLPPAIQIIDSHTDKITGTITLPEGSNPWDMAYAGTNKIYVTNLLANNISVINTETREITQSIAVGEAPQGIIIADNMAYVANTGGYPDYSPSTVSIIDIRSDSVIKSLPVPMNPQDFARSPDGTIHLVCSGNFAAEDGKIVIIDPFGDIDYTPVVTDTIDIGGYAGDIIITKDAVGMAPDFGDASNGFLYIYNAITRQIQADASNPVRIGRGAMQLIYDQNLDHIFVSNFADDTIEELDANASAVLYTYSVGDGPQAMVMVENSAAFNPWADSVLSFTPGEGAGFGQNFYPDNVLGPPDPDPALDSYNASNKPQEILSLGHGGEIVLAFTDEYIVDGDGPDFVVYENVFISFFTDEPFIEAAFVAVSMNGSEWLTFPWDTTSFAGFAGVTPTANGGDRFDLNVVGLPYAKFVKLTDIGDLKKEGLYNGDFDLDAVGVLNGPTGISDNPAQIIRTFKLLQNYPNPFNPSTNIEFTLHTPALFSLKIFDITGRQVRQLVEDFLSKGTYQFVWDGKDNKKIDVASGLYYYQLKCGDYFQTKKMILLR